MSKFLKIFAPASAGAASVLTMAYFLADQFVVDIPAPVRGAFIHPAQAQETATPAVIEPTPVSLPQGGLGLGRAAMPMEIAAWDIDVRPDGQGLPVGSGDVFTGEEIYIEKCSVCHGDFGEARGRWPQLAGGQGTLEHDDPVKTIGSYWPYLSTVYDYVYRAMPFGEAQSLEPDEVYAITAYLLYLNDLVDDDFELSNANFLEVDMPNADNFFMDDRAETELPIFVSADICMENCKDSVEITMHASVIDVTPDTEETAIQAAVIETAPEPAAEPETAVAEAAEAPHAADPALIAAGEAAFRQCQACHQVGDGAVNRTGPVLNGMLGRTIGSVDGFRYSNVFADAAGAGEIWTEERLSAFLANPRQAMSGTRMSFRGVRDDDEIAALIAYLESFAD
ncbi:c-type cytochrome [Yoonia sp.]|uniref:c-type cytochrome n=1 Tax=Yoonia sp. TaxID=2212373 RepID=UPI0019FCDAB3|nr:c-type cytochrome [Yoonia sp.]MBE0412723.1 c-type cytochrome [Yoonia sp.]